LSTFLSFLLESNSNMPPSFVYSQRKTTLGLVSYRNRIQSVCLPYHVPCEKSNKWFKPFLYIPNQSTHIQNSDSPSRYFPFFLVVSLEQDQKNIKIKKRERDDRRKVINKDSYKRIDRLDLGIIHTADWAPSYFSLFFLGIIIMIFFLSFTPNQFNQKPPSLSLSLTSRSGVCAAPGPLH
jgi:hypothetical protein